MITNLLTPRDQKILVGIIFFIIVIPSLLLFAFATGANVTEQNNNAGVLGAENSINVSDSGNYECVTSNGETFNPLPLEQSNGNVVCDCPIGEICSLRVKIN